MEPEEIPTEITKLTYTAPFSKAGRPLLSQNDAARVLAHFWPEIEKVIRLKAARAVYKLKSPAPEGSAHYQAGWDDAIEAAFNAARLGEED